MLSCSVCTLALPYSADLGPYVVFWMRTITGLCQGVITPTLYTILPHWIPKNELGLAFGFVVASGNLGAFITMPICGYLSEYGFAGGWPSVFYLFGSLGLLTLLPWLCLVYETPDAHPCINDRELEYIKRNCIAASSDCKKRKALVPWRSILTSRKVWAISIARFSGGWISLQLMSKLPSYLKSVLHIPITYVSHRYFVFCFVEN